MGLFVELASAAMEFAGTVYFDFMSGDAWRLFVLLSAAEQEGVGVTLEWKGFAVDGLGEAPGMPPGQRALAAHAAVVDPKRQRRLREALFTLVHSQHDSLDDDLTYRAAAKVAGLDGTVLLDAIEDVGYRTLTQQHRAAEAAGVTAVPSIVRQGPPLLVTSTPAMREGRAKPRLEIIDRMLDDDGLWRLVKP